MLNKQFFEIGDLISLNRSVTCPVIKSFDRTKGKIWPDNICPMTGTSELHIYLE
jgi:hypothetical protein